VEAHLLKSEEWMYAIKQYYIRRVAELNLNGVEKLFKTWNTASLIGCQDFRVWYVPILEEQVLQPRVS
jgi:hypothetical protein